MQWPATLTYSLPMASEPTESNTAGMKRASIVLTTTHPVAAYGGLQLSREVLVDLAQSLRDGSLPMMLDHDRRRPLRSVVLDSGVRARADGHEEAWAEILVDAAQWTAFEQQLEEAGAPGGMSFSMSTPLLDSNDRSSAAISISADAHHFTKESIVQVATELSERGELTVEPCHYFQFGADPLPKVIFEYAVALWAAMPPELLGAYLYDSMRRLIRVRKTTPEPATTFEFHASGKGKKREFKGVLQTNSEEVALEAIKQFGTLLRDEGAFEFRPDSGRWKRLED